MADSISDTRKMEPYPVSGSMPLTTSIMEFSARLEMPRGIRRAENGLFP